MELELIALIVAFLCYICCQLNFKLNTFFDINHETWTSSLLLAEKNRNYQELVCCLIYFHSMWKAKLAFIINTFIYFRKAKNRHAITANNKTEACDEHSSAEAAIWIGCFYLAYNFNVPYYSTLNPLASIVQLSSWLFSSFNSSLAGHVTRALFSFGNNIILLPRNTHNYFIFNGNRILNFRLLSSKHSQLKWWHCEC